MAEGGRPRPLALVGEAARMAMASPVGSVVTGLLVAAACGVILATVGQTAAAERDVLARIDDAGTRSVVVVDTEGRALIRPDAVERVAALSGIEWVIGLGPATDVTNYVIAGGNPAPARTVYGTLPGPPYVETSPWEREGGTAIVGTEARLALGLAIPAGTLEASGGDLAVVGWIHAADPLSFLNRSVLKAPDPDDPDAVLRAVHVLAGRPEDVAPLADAIVSVVAADDPTSLAVETSEAFAQVRAAVAGELGRFGRQLVTLILGAALVLVGLTVYGSVTSRRRDFGRRRALGASRSTLVGLVLAQTFVVSLVGAAIGTVAGAQLTHRWTAVAPDLAFTTAVATLAVLTAVVAALPPALVAAHRDPVRILRVP